MGKNNAKQRVFVEFKIGHRSAGRVTIELYFDLTPKTSQHFIDICRGLNRSASLFGTQITRVVEDSFLKADIPTMSHSDESFARRHAHAGVISMTGKSNLIITLNESSQLDG
jgi:cyclophilin family peptidyl-prolyl cis-trans isomerase